MQNNFSRPIIFLQMESGIFKMHFYCRNALLLLLFYDSFVSRLGKSLCRDHEFKCNNGKCINRLRICDSKNDFGDDSDESRTDGPLCGMSNYVFKTMIQILVSSGIEDT